MRNTSENKDETFLTIAQFAARIGVHPATLRRWHKNGTLLPHHLTPGGSRAYTADQIEEYFKNHAAHPDKESSAQ